VILALKMSRRCSERRGALAITLVVFSKYQAGRTCPVKDRTSNLDIEVEQGGRSAVRDNDEREDCCRLTTHEEG
jgi:hypothetical protein